MDRRKAMKLAGGAVAAGGVGLFVMANAFGKPESVKTEPYKPDYSLSEGEWPYTPLDPDVTAELAYAHYKDGSCMYATVKSVVSQLADRFGRPYDSFPYHIFKYGHGGVGGYGSICGALNGAAALIGLLIQDKGVQDQMITDIFQWYEKEAFPAFVPNNPVSDVAVSTSVSNSILCHASNTNWCKKSGFKANSNERKERCRRLTSDVAKKVAGALNELSLNVYVANLHSNAEVNSCVACHGDAGKLGNTSVKMSCNSCHTESLAHKVFADAHYKFMGE